MPLARLDFFDFLFGGGRGIRKDQIDWSVADPDFVAAVVAQSGDFSPADAAKLGGIEAGAQVNPARAGAFTAADEAKLDDAVTTEDLEGKETDRYFSFTNAENDYWPGTIKFYDQTSGVPDVANLIRQPDIAAGDITVAVGTPRLDRDPNTFQLGTQYEAADFVSGQVYYLRDWNAKTDSGTLTLTSGGTVVGSGNARRVYFRATLALIGADLADVRDNGDYWRFATETGTSIDLRLPAGDVLAPPWVRPTGVGLTDAEISTDTALLLPDGDHMTVGEQTEWHDEHHVGTFTITGLTYVTTSTPTGGDQVNFALNALDDTKGLLTYKYPDEDARDSLKAKVVVGRTMALVVGSAQVLGTVASTPSDLFGRLSFNFNDVQASGALLNNHAASLIVDSKIPSRAQVDDLIAGVTPDVYAANHTSSTWTVVAAIVDTSIYEIGALVRRTSTGAWYQGALLLRGDQIPTATGQGVWTSRTTDQGRGLSGARTARPWRYGRRGRFTPAPTSCGFGVRDADENRVGGGDLESRHRLHEGLARLRPLLRGARDAPVRARPGVLAGRG